MARDSREPKRRKLSDMPRFPPTVVDHTEYSDGVELHLLDPGTDEKPRAIQIYDDKQSEMYL